MEDREIRAALDRRWAASDANDFEAEHDIHREDAVLEYPQSGRAHSWPAADSVIATRSREPETLHGATDYRRGRPLGHGICPDL